MGWVLDGPLKENSFELVLALEERGISQKINRGLI